MQLKSLCTCFKGFILYTEQQRNRETEKEIFILLGALILILLIGCSKKPDALEPKPLISSSSTPEEELLQTAMWHYDQGNFTTARSLWIELRDSYPNSYYSTLADLKIADAHFYAEDYASAVVAYEEFSRVHRGHEATPYVMHQIGESYLKQYRGPAYDQTPLRSAIKAFEQLVKEFPLSRFAGAGKQRLDESRDYFAQHEAYVADFYERTGKSEASAHRYQTMNERFPHPDPSSTPPETPEVIAALLPEPVSEPRLVELVSPPSVSEEEPRSEPPLFSRLECGEMENVLVFIVYLNRPVSLADETRESDRRILWFPARDNAEDLSPGNDPSLAPATSCDAGKSELAAVERRGPSIHGSTRGVELTLEVSDVKFEVTPIVLDRPHRIVLITRVRSESFQPLSPSV